MMSKIWRAISGAKPERGLVEQEQPRPAHQRARDGEHLLLAPRQRAAALVEPLAQAAETAPARGRGRRARPRAGGERAHLQILEHGHARKDAPSFRRLGDVEPRDLVGWQPRDVAAGEHDRAFARARIAADGHHQGRLAGAVRPDQRDDLAFADLEVDALERDECCRNRPSRRAPRGSGWRLRLTARPPLRPSRPLLVLDAQIGGDHLRVGADRRPARRRRS